MKMNQITPIFIGSVFVILPLGSLINQLVALYHFESTINAAFTVSLFFHFLFVFLGAALLSKGLGLTLFDSMRFKNVLIFLLGMSLFTNGFLTGLTILPDIIYNLKLNSWLDFECVVSMLLGIYFFYKALNKNKIGPYGTNKKDYKVNSQNYYK